MLPLAFNRLAEKSLSLSKGIGAFESNATSSVTNESPDPSVRGQILEFIRGHPGTHLRQIKRELNLSMGSIQYHLYGLEKEKKILARRRGLYKRFYVNLVFGENQYEILDVLSQETERDLLLYIITSPNATQKQLAEYASISAGTINWHMKRLIDSGLVEMRREGQFARYEIKCDKDQVLHLLRGFHPTIWERWADRFANALSTTANLEEQTSPRENEEKIEQQ